MQASTLTHTQARRHGSAAIHLACAMALDLSTLHDTKGFEFQAYNEALSEASGLELQTVRNTMGVAKQLVSLHHSLFASLVENYALSDAALTRAVQHVYGLLNAGAYGRSLPELVACLKGKASPMLVRQRARADAAARANEALLQAMKPQAPVTEPAASAPAEAPADAPAEAPADAPVTEPPAEAPAEAPAPVTHEVTAPVTEPAVISATSEVLVGVTTITGPGDIVCDVPDTATAADILDMATALMELAEKRAAKIQPEALAA